MNLMATGTASSLMQTCVFVQVEVADVVVINKSDTVHHASLQHMQARRILRMLAVGFEQSSKVIGTTYHLNDLYMGYN